MADINNYTEISENFNTIKTLLNSIRAQGILNTSDVDKLLAGINSKLEKINTDEDIDLIKIFLSDLKQNLDERHSVLLSKFGAIESLFSNLLKNSSEALKSSEVKELFDIVATNLSVFSREVVSQKETLSDITLRLDAIRSDDSQKKDIIKNITFLKNDLERLTNGFDSIVLSLNENFKTVIKSISNIDPSDSVKNFGKELTDIANSSSTILSAIQMLDKKNLQIEDLLRGMATHDDLVSTKKWISDLVTQEQQIVQSVDNLADKYYKIDNLAEKIDASVEIIVALKALITDKDDCLTAAIIERLNQLEDFVRGINSNNEFDEFKTNLEKTLYDIQKESSNLKAGLSLSSEELQKINESIKSLDINANFKTLSAEINKSEQNVSESLNRESDKIIQFVDINTTRALNEITNSADNLSAKLIESHAKISNICEKSFSDIESDISSLKDVVSQIDENNVSANNAIFSNITDRLALFENNLKNSLSKQEESVANSSTNLLKQISGLKELSGILDYKMDSSVIEINNAKSEFADLKESVDKILALDFAQKVSEFKVDLYSTKQDLISGIEASTTDLSEKLTNDLFSKYELLISKLDAVEEEIKGTQSEALTTVKNLLANISSSILDILSYVSADKKTETGDLELKLEDIDKSIKDISLGYIENIRDIVELARLQIDERIKKIQESSSAEIQRVNGSIVASTKSIRDDIENSYNKLVEVEKCFDDIKNVINANNETISTSIEGVISTTSLLKNDFEKKLASMHAAVLDKVSEFQKEFTCENADKISEIKFISENLHTKQLQNEQILNDELKGEIAQITGVLKLNIEALAEQVSSSSIKLDSLGHVLTNSLQNGIEEHIKDNKIELSANIENVSRDLSNKLETTTQRVNNICQNINENVQSIKSDIDEAHSNNVLRFEDLKQSMASDIQAKTSEIEEKLDNTNSKLYDIQNLIETKKSDLTQDINEHYNKTSAYLEEISENVNSNIKNVSDLICEKVSGSVLKLDDVKTNIEDNIDELTKRIDEKLFVTNSKIDNIDLSVNNLSQTTTNSMASTLAKILDNFVSLKALLANLNEKTIDDIKITIYEIKEDYQKLKNNIEAFDTTIDDDLTKQLSIIENNFISLNNLIERLFTQSEQSIQNTINTGLENITEELNNSISSSLAGYKTQIDLIFHNIENENSEYMGLLDTKILELKDILNSSLEVLNTKSQEQLKEISGNLNNILRENIDVTEKDYNNLKISLSNFVTEMEAQNTSNSESIKNSINAISEILRMGLQTQNDKFNEDFEKLKIKIEEITSSTSNFQENIEDKFANISANIDGAKSDIIYKNDNLEKNMNIKICSILDNIKTLSESLNVESQGIKKYINDGFSETLNNLYEKICSLIEQNSFDSSLKYNESISKLLDDIDTRSIEIKEYFETLNERLDKDEISRMNVFQAQLSELGNSFNCLIEDVKKGTKEEIDLISSSIVKNSKESLSELEQSLEQKVNLLLATSADISAGELKSMEVFADKILEQVKISQNNITTCKTLIIDFIKNELKVISDAIENEADSVGNKLLEQMSIMRDFQRDELIRITEQIQEKIEDSIYNNLNDLKSYIDLKSDKSVINSKLDVINSSLNKTAEDMLSVSNKLLSTSVFENSMLDMKTTNEILISTMADNLNSQIQNFLKLNIEKDIIESFNLFDKKFIDTVVEKYEEIKVINLQYKASLEEMHSSIGGIISNFVRVRDEIYDVISTITEGVNTKIDSLSLGFADLKAQILSKSFDEAFQSSITDKISGIENLVKEQFGFIEDISDLCCNNLPELTEMNALVKYNIINSLGDLNKKLDEQSLSIEEDIASLKTEVITQFLNIFNQISFVTEQEEILDFIQEKHSELITILSHIVTKSVEVVDIKSNVTEIDSKVDTIKEDINSINEKITSIMTSDGNVDYVYSLQDLESDIANLRLTLNDLKENNNNNSKELENILKSTNTMYTLLESLKNEFPKFDSEEFKKDFEALSEDIVSISTRTNKLILASDESYKTLQDNLQDFKLVINDLDERTRNFARESGIDKIDSKLGIINSMIQNGAKTNQVFNQVFEYLAEWVDNAGTQISAISDKVETLDDIGQIKVMLEDLKAEAEDNTESAELVEALGNVFDKQAKKISSLEAKLDKVIVETKINTKSNKVDLSPLEETMNRFLVSIDDKMVLQQQKIDLLESKLENLASLINPKDAAQLTKKVGGMDRQIAKLNKSIERIASHVVEK